MRSKCSFFSIMLIFILAAAAYDPICEEYYRSQDVWLMGEAPDNSPFASQYLAILAYIPTAIVLNSYLVVSDLSVQEPIRRSEAVIGWQSGRAPFSSFFDFERYEKYWSNHHVKIISASSYSSCFTTETETAGRLSHTLAELVRVPEFLPYARRTFNILIDYANFTAGRKLPPFPFPPHHQIRIKSRFKMAALYSFWNDTTPLLSYVLASLKPAAPIQAAADALVRSLPRDFIAVHVRLDDEGLEELATSTVRLRAATAALSPEEKETMLLTEIVAAIRDSSCLQESFKAQAISGRATTLYLVTNYKPSVPSTKLRTVRLYDALRKLGTFDVVTRKTLAHRIVKDKEKRFNSELRSAVKSMSTMSPEHWSFIDMLVSDQSFCFLPSPISSLTSYVIERQRKLSRKILEKYDDINAQTYGAMHTYRDWGF